MLVSRGQTICSGVFLLTLLFTESFILQFGINLVSSGSEMGSSIETGELATSDAAQERLVAKISNGAKQSLWWQLATAKWHSDALVRYFAAGPLKPEEMCALAKQSGKGNPPKPADVQRPIDILQALRNISTTFYQMNSSIKGTGQIITSMLTLMFHCYGDSCTQGIVPVIFFNDTKEDAVYFTSVWMRFSETMLVNAPPSSINKFPPPKKYVFNTSHGAGVSDLSLEINIQDRKKIPFCPIAVMASSRTILDTAFGLMPGTTCIQIDSKHVHDPLRILISIGSASGNNENSLHYIISDYLNIPGGWNVLPANKCYTDVVLRIENSSFDLVTVCLKKYCVQSSWQEIQCSGDSGRSSYPKLAFLVAMVNITHDCTVQKYDGSHSQPLTNFTELQDAAEVVISCPMMATGGFCNVSISSVVDVADGLRMVNSVSNWSNSNGLNTSEFHNHALDPRLRPCTLRLSGSVPLSYTILSSSSSKEMITLPSQIQSGARDYMSSHISQHHSAFTTEKGVATDLYTFSALVVTTALSVLLGDVAAVFTYFYFKCRLKIQPFYLDRAADSTRKWANVALPVVCTLLLCAMLFVPVLVVAANEIDRQRPFHTWNVASSDFMYGSSGSGSSQVRVVYILSATSKYKSRFLIPIPIVVLVICILASIRSFHRCNRVLTSYKMLKDSDRTDDNGLEKVKYRSLKAIGMTNAEYLEQKNSLEQRHPQLQPPLTSTSNATHSVEMFSQDRLHTGTPPPSSTMSISCYRGMPTSTECSQQPTTLVSSSMSNKALSFPRTRRDASETAPLIHG